MVHGDCSSRGCYAMTDEQISEIYALGRDSFFGGQKSFQVQAYPFRMTPQNMAKHRNNPHIAFWRMLKKGNDHFEVTRLEPKVDVCEKRYVFDAEAPGGARPLSFSPAGKCPAYRSAGRDRQRGARQAAQGRDPDRRAEPRAIRRLAPIRTNADGGMHPVFVAAVKRNQIGVAPQEAAVRLDAARNHSGHGAPAAHPRACRCADRRGDAALPPQLACSSEVVAVRRWPLPSPHPRPAGREVEQAATCSAACSRRRSAEQDGERARGAIDRMARLVGLGAQGQGHQEGRSCARAGAEAEACGQADQPSPRNGAIRAKQAEAAADQDHRSADAARRRPAPPRQLGTRGTAPARADERRGAGRSADRQPSTAAGQAGLTG